MIVALRATLLAAIVLTGGSLPAAAAEARFVTMDWTIVETMLALDVVPVGVSEVAAYRAWVGTPEIPDGVRDIGLRSQPNLELLAELSPDRILLSRMFRSLAPVMSRIAPTSFVDNRTDDDAWRAMVAQTEQIGRLVDRTAAAALLIQSTDQHLQALRERLADRNAPLLVVQFMDAVHVRVFGANSLYGAVLQRLGQRNDWDRPTNSWGFSLVSLDALAGREARLLVVEPLPVGIDLASNGMWQSLPSVRRGGRTQPPSRLVLRRAAFGAPLRRRVGFGAVIAASPPARVCLVLALLVPLLAGTSGAFTAPDIHLLHHGWWPRLVMSLLAGGGLALAGAIMQQALQNPLATPTTLGVVSGAQFGLLIASLLFPGLLGFGREWVAMAGAGLAMGAVVLLTWRRGLAPLAVVLAGLVIELYLGSLGIVMLLLHQEELNGILIWGAGSLAQSGWEGVALLWPRLLVLALLTGLLVRPIDVLALGDGQARSLGLGLLQVRLGALAIAVALAACVTSIAGVVGFVGLAAPLIVRLLGVRAFAPVACWSVVIGALLLAVTDLALQSAAALSPTIIPTGAMTAVLGGALLLWLLPRLRLAARPRLPRTARAGAAVPPRTGVMIAALVVAGALSLLAGQSLDGWRWFDLAHAGAMLEWRLPRTMAAASAGAILALAGVIVQRLTRNPMASPELLGVSGGAALGLIGALLLSSGASMMVVAGGGILGAIVGIAVVVLLNYRNGFRPERVLLTGVAVTATVHGVQAVLLAGGDPRGQQAIAWMSRSTYYVDLPAAATMAVIALLALLIVPLFSRWLDLLPLGPETAAALGLEVNASRMILLLIVAVLTASATLIVGPLSFVGLLAPHLARLAGFTRARAHLLGAAGIGALLMIVADWIGRQLLYPQEIPAGLVACVVGGAYFLLVATRRL